MSVEIYTRTTCGPCHQIKNYLKQKGVAFTERNVDGNPALEAEIVERTGFLQVPMTVINGTAVSGPNIGKINSLLAQA